MFGVSEGYLIEGGKVTRPCRGATLIGNCLEALARIDAVASDFEMKTGFCGKGGQRVPVGTGPGPRADRRADGGGDGGLMGDDLAAIAERAVEAALAAGAGDAEAYVQDSPGPRDPHLRRRGGEPDRGWGARRGGALLDRPPGRLRLRHGAERRGARRDRRDAVETARIADADEFAAPPSADGDAAPPEIPGLHDPALAGWSTERKVELAKGIERAARQFDERVVGVETAVYADEEQRVAIASSTGLAGAFEATTAYAYLQAIAEGGGDKQTGLGFGMGRSPEGLDQEEIGREGAERAASLLGARKPGSRTCPVVLDPTVAASFIGFIGGTLCADAVQRGRSPFAGRLGEAVGLGGPHGHRPRHRPRGPQLLPLRRGGRPPRPNPPDRGRQARRLPPRLLHGPPRAGRGRGRRPHHRQRLPRRLPLPALGLHLEPVVAPGAKSFEELLAEAGEGVYVTDVAGLHSGVNPVSGTFSVGATGRLIEGGRLAAPADEFTIASDLQSMLTAITAAASEPRWVPFGGSVNAPALLIGEMAVGGS